MQQYADEVPQAQRYSTDQLAVYGDLLWPDTPQGEGSTYVVSYGKEQTYTIESINADLRTYAPTWAVSSAVIVAFLAP